MNLKTPFIFTVWLIWSFFCFMLINHHTLRLQEVELRYPSGVTKTKTLPIFEKTIKEGFVEMTLRFNSPPSVARELRLTIDDCVERIHLNGVKLKYAGLKCLDPTGVLVDISKTAHAGKNELKLKAYDVGGKLKFNAVVEKQSFGFTFFIFTFIIGSFLFWRMILAPVSSDSLRFLLGLLTFSLISRAVFIYLLHLPEDYVYADMWGHVNRANDILKGTPNPSSIEKPPGYHLLVTLSLYLAQNFNPIKLFHLLAGASIPFIVLKASRRYLGRDGAQIAAAMLAVHIPIIFIGGILMAELLFTFVLSLLFLSMSASRYPWRIKEGLRHGALFMLAFWLKGTHVFFAPIAGLWSFFVAWRSEKLSFLNAWIAQVKPWSSFVVGAVLVLFLQLGITNYIYGTSKFPSAGAVNLIEGKCGGGKHYDNRGSYRFSPLFAELGQSRPHYWDFGFDDVEATWQQGLNCIIENPAVLIKSLSGIHHLVFENDHWPFVHGKFHWLNSWYAAIYGFFIFPGILMGVTRLLKKPLHPRVMPVLLIAGAMFCVWIFKSEYRFRVPFDVVFIPVSVLGWLFLLKSVFPARYKKIARMLCILYVSVVGFTISWSFIVQIATNV